MTIIHDVDEFMANIKPGDTFWTFTTLYGQPTGFSEIVFVRHDEDLNRKSKNLGPWIIRRYANGFELEASVSDLCSQVHGVTTSLEEARAESARRDEAYRNDSDWQDRVDQERRMSHMFSGL